MDAPDDRLRGIEQSLQQGQVRAAFDLCRSILRDDPGHARTTALLGLAYVLMGDEAEARRTFERAIEIAPLDSRVRYYGYLGYHRLRDDMAARAQLTYLCRLEPDNVPAKSLLAQSGGPVPGLPPLPRPAAAAIWYDGGGQATFGSAECAALEEDGEPPPGPDVIECPECERRTWRGWVCKFCGARLDLASPDTSDFARR